MKNLVFLVTLVFTFSNLNAQSLFDEYDNSSLSKDLQVTGYARSGFYLNRLGDNPVIETGFADLTLRFTAGDGSHYKAYADLRSRYGAEFGEQKSVFGLKEAWVAWYTACTELKMGQQVVRWGRSEFFGLGSAVNPRNDLYRSYDNSDRDLGNIMANLKINLSSQVDIQALLIPFYRQSVLMTDIVEMPDMINLNNPGQLLIDKQYLSYGLRLSTHLKGFDFSAGWFDGYNPMPGISLRDIYMPASPEDGNPVINMDISPYRLKVLNADAEIVAGRSLLRIEGSVSKPAGSQVVNENVPFPEINWVGGYEFSAGNLYFILEYTGKYISDFTDPVVDPALPGESEFINLAGLTQQEIYEYIRLKTASFNRLFNYQLNEVNHSAAIRISYDNGLGIIRPEINLIANFTSSEYLVIPRISYSPADNITITCGAEIFQGEQDSLFDLINEEISSIYLGIKINF